MNRPWIEFIQAQVLPWQDGLYGSGRADVESKILSQDTELGEATVLVRYPVNWERLEEEYLTSDEEIFVLSGSLVIGDRAFNRYDYAYLPKGFPRPQATSSDGAVVLSFFYSEPKTVKGVAPIGYYNADRLVINSDFYNTGWARDYSGINAPEMVVSGARKRILRSDGETGDQTWLIGSLPLRHERKTETHPVVQEMYLLEGELAGNTGLMKPGAYFWRPEGKLHGPYGSKTGNVILMRSRGGALSTEYFDLVKPFSFDVPHQPILPPELDELGRKPWKGNEPF